MRTSTPLPATLLPFLFLSLLSFSAAFPTLRLRSSNNAPAAASFEPLFLRAAPQVGPTRSLERLRQRNLYKRELLGDSEAEVEPEVATIEARSVVKNPKRSLAESLVKRDMAPRVVLNPKKRSLEARSLPVVVARRQPLNLIDLVKRQFAPSSVAASNQYTVTVDDAYFSATPTDSSLATATGTDAVFSVGSDGGVKVVATTSSAAATSSTATSTSDAFPTFPTDNTVATTTDSGVFSAVATGPVKVVASDSASSSSTTVAPFAPSSVAPAGAYTITVDDSYFSATPTDSALASAGTDAVFSVGSDGGVKVVQSITRTPLRPPVTQRTPVPQNADSTSLTTTTTTSLTTSVTLTTTTRTTTLANGAILSTSTVAPTTSTRATTSASSTRATTSSTSAAAPTKTGSWPTGNFIAGSYYPDWDGDLLPPRAVDMSLYDYLAFSFAVPTSSFGLAWTQDNSETLLRQLITYAHGNNTKVLITIGGWTDSNYFSLAVNSATNRNTFATNIATYVSKYGADGVDIDWEYPGTNGADGNNVSPSDSANFLLFLQLLRTKLGTTKRITAAVTQQAFIGANGSPLADVSAYAAVLDGILVMNYDVWGSSSSPGPNAPLSNACAGSAQPNANEKSGIAAWTAAGMPASKILMGVPSYGYISSSTATTLIHKRWTNGKRSYVATDSTDTTMSNRERAAAQFAEGKKSHMRKWFEMGQIKRARRDEARRALKRSQRKSIDSDTLAKKATIIVCPNNHSGLPCPGVTDQNITDINWNPLNGTTGGSTNGTTGPDGVFTPGVGVGKLGNGDLAAIDGNQIQFYQLISYGVIVQSGTSTTYNAVNGYTRAWDSCSSTPYLYNKARKVVITYDDPQSLILKGQLAAASGIGGIAMWDISGDTDNWDLVKAWRNGLGI